MNFYNRVELQSQDKSKLSITDALASSKQKLASNYIALLIALLLLIVSPFNLRAQVIMSNGTTTTCSSLFYDSGGSGDDYSDDETFVHTFIPATPGSKIKISFSSFDIEKDWDYLYIYDGNSTAAALIGTYTGSSIPPSFTSTAADGSLTIKFTSDVSIKFFGWEANISCTSPCTGTPIAGTASSSIGTALLCVGSSADLTVTGATATSHGITYQWDSSASASGPWYSIAGATLDKLTVSPPISCANIYYRRAITCMASGASAFTSPVLVSTACVSTPYSEDFESITAANQLPKCMSATSFTLKVRTYITSTTWNRSNHTPGGSKYAAFEWGCDDYLFTPPINIIAGKTYEFSFWYIADGVIGWDSLRVDFGKSPTKAAMTTRIGTTLTGIVNTTYQKYSTSFVVSASGPQIFGIYSKSRTDPWYLSIDDIQLKEVPPCAGIPTPGLAKASDTLICGIGTTVLSLPSLPLALGYSYRWEDSTSGGTWASDASRPSYGGSTLPFTTVPFSTNTYFRCVVKCLASGDSAISLPVLVKAGPLDLPYNQDFESIAKANELPKCMSATRINPYVQTNLSAAFFNQKNHTIGGNKYATFRYGADDYLFSPSFYLKAGEPYIMSFWYITDGYSGWNELSAKILSAPKSTSVVLPLKALSNPRNTTYQQYADTFSVASSGVYYFGIYCNATSAPFYLSIDDINLQNKPCNGMPLAGKIHSSVPFGSAVCARTRVTLSDIGATPKYIPGILYQWQRRSIGSSSAWANVVAANDTLLVADTLVGYEYRFMVICKNSNDTSYSSSYPLAQIPDHPSVSISPSSSPLKFCIGDTVKFNASNYVGSVYDWMIDGVVVPGWKFSDMAATKSGVYQVRVSSPVYCPVLSNQVTLIANDPGYTVDLASPADSFICDGGSINLLASSSKLGLSYQWQKDNSIIPGATTSSYLVTTSGYYRASAWDGLSDCPALSRSIYIRVKPNPPATITIPSSSTTACENEGVLLKANSGAYSYQWMRGGSTVVGWIDSTILITNSGTYSIKIRDADGCVSISSSVTINILPSPTPIIVRKSFVLELSMPYISYQWLRNGKDMLGRTKDTLQLTHNGLYRVRVTDANGCEGLSVPIEVYDNSLDIANISIESDEVKLYPNPTSGKVFVESPVVLDIEVIDGLGKSLFHSMTSKEIDLNKYPDGVYLFIIRHDNQIIKSVKIIKAGH